MAQVQLSSKRTVRKNNMSRNLKALSADSQLEEKKVVVAMEMLEISEIAPDKSEEQVDAVLHFDGDTFSTQKKITVPRHSSQETDLVIDSSDEEVTRSKLIDSDSKY